MIPFFLNVNFPRMRREAETAFILHFLLSNKVIYRLSKTQFTPAVILERCIESD